MHIEHGRLILVRGAGDLASGVLARLHRAGYAVGALECERPTAIRRTVSFSEAVYEGRISVEGIEARLVANAEDFLALAATRTAIPLLVDPGATSLTRLRPSALVDAIVAKKSLGTRRGLAPLVIALGPGFEAVGLEPSGANGAIEGSAGLDAGTVADLPAVVDAVIETNRGHDLGRVIWKGRAAADTGLPAELGGVSADRVLRAPVAGLFHPLEEIGTFVHSGQVIAYIENNNERFNVSVKIDGILRGCLHADAAVTSGFKVADVDPRGLRANCFTISDKARAVGGGVLEALLAAGVLP